jgi:diketogulonate reductase-like aldo/keto reductase
MVRTSTRRQSSTRRTTASVDVDNRQRAPHQSALRTTQLPSGEVVPVLGQGTWQLGDHPGRREEELKVLRLGLDLGMTLIDTAEMYGDGAAEELVGEAIAGRRNKVFLVSKVLPEHATRRGTIAACERSLTRLNTDHLDLYLLHWRGEIALEETLAGFDALMRAGKIRRWGVSNFDVSDMEELVGLRGGSAVMTDQVLYNLMRRGIEFDLRPWCRERRIPIMAYSPVEQGLLAANSKLQDIVARHDATPAQVALAWIVRQEGIIAIPKAGTPEHVRENRAALDIVLDEKDLVELDRVFPPPRRKVPLQML